jgi:hypothetical protein
MMIMSNDYLVHVALANRERCSDGSGLSRGTVKTCQYIKVESSLPKKEEN